MSIYESGLLPIINIVDIRIMSLNFFLNNIVPLYMLLGVTTSAQAGTSTIREFKQTTL